MSFAFSAAPVNENMEPMVIKNSIDKKNVSKNKTIKKRPTHVNDMISKLHESDMDDDNLADFVPMPKAESAGTQRTIDREPDEPIESFSDLHNYASTNIQPTMPTYYNQMSENTSGNKDLLEKLNYMIYLMEEQKDEKTGHVTEEVILYSFLGIFMIFIVDSFARAGKYVR